MSPEEVSNLTGLNISDAKRAKKREFDEPFVFKGTRIEELKMIKMIHDMGFEYTQGEYYHLMGRSDKGRAVRILKDLFRNEYGDIITIALGDGLNDLSMLKEADYPVLIKKPDGSYDLRIRFKGLRKAGGTGPQGWNRAVKRLLNHLKLSSSEGKSPRSTSSL
jgi:mannosyl-3-phosphoglycerate phosphatase